MRRRLLCGTPITAPSSQRTPTGRSADAWLMKGSSHYNSRTVQPRSNCHQTATGGGPRNLRWRLTARLHESGRPGSNRRRPAWEAFVALVGQGFFGGGSRNGITQYRSVRFRLAISQPWWSSVRVSDPWLSPPRSISTTFPSSGRWSGYGGETEV